MVKFGFRGFFSPRVLGWNLVLGFEVCGLGFMFNLGLGFVSSKGSRMEPELKGLGFRAA